MTNKNRFLCKVDDISDPGSKGFYLEKTNERFFLVKKDNQFYAYSNHCPHTGAPLEWKPDQFLDLEKRLIQCALHGALFDMQNGKCLRGPCAGQSLVSIEVKVSGGKVFLVRETDTASAS